MRKYLPVKRQTNKHNLIEKNTKNPAIPVNFSNFFKGNSLTSKDATQSGRVHCVAIDRTAIMYDKHGNKLVLKEHQTTMNAPKNSPGLHFRHNKHSWTKNR